MSRTGVGRLVFRRIRRVVGRFPFDRRRPSRDGPFRQVALAARPRQGVGWPRSSFHQCRCPSRTARPRPVCSARRSARVSDPAETHDRRSPDIRRMPCRPTGARLEVSHREKSEANQETFGRGLVGALNSGTMPRGRPTVEPCAGSETHAQHSVPGSARVSDPAETRDRRSAPIRRRSCNVAVRPVRRQRPAHNRLAIRSGRNRKPIRELLVTVLWEGTTRAQCEEGDLRSGACAGSQTRAQHKVACSARVSDPAENRDRRSPDIRRRPCHPGLRPTGSLPSRSIGPGKKETCGQTQ